MSNEQTKTTSAFPNIRARPIGDGRIGVTISGAEYSLTRLDVHLLQNALTWAMSTATPKEPLS
jgi:hypothetical protein